MKKLYIFPAIIITLFVNICAQESSLNVPGEKHLTNIKQLTFGGENAEAYFSSDGKQLSFQSKRDGHGCDQVTVFHGYFPFGRSLKGYGGS